MMKILSIFSFLLFATVGYSQSFLDADSTGDAYTRITKKLFDYEVPDCVHPIPHITEEWNAELKKWAFVFGLHVSNTPKDNDRCLNYDRQRTEIKTMDSSPDSMKAFYGETMTNRWKFKLDSGFQPTTSFTHIHQIKAGDGSMTDNPTVTITVVDTHSVERLQLRFGHMNNDGNYDYVYSTLLAPLKGVWVEATEKIKYDSVAGTYSLVIKRVDNEQVLINVNYSNVCMWRRTSTFLRPKWGDYRSLNDSLALRDEYIRFDDFSMDKGTIGTAPSAPSSLTTSCTIEGRIKLTWVHNGLTEDQFRIDRSTNGGTTWAYYAPAPQNSTTYTDTVTATNNYYYRVRAENTFGNSAFSASANYNYVPVDYFYSKSTGNLDVITNWGSNTDGSGIAPAYFSNAGRKYVIRNRSAATIGASWTIPNISTGSKIIIGDGTNACNFTVPSAYSVSGTIDVSANATLTWTNAGTPTLGTLNSVSTVNYNQSGSFTVPSAPLSYGNLSLTGGTKIFSPVNYTIAGNLVFDGALSCNGGASPFTAINLSGNYTLQNSATFDTSQSNRLTLVCNGTSSQTLTGNGKEIILSRLTISNTSGVILSNLSGSNLTVGNLAGGGIAFTTPANFLNVNNNKVTFYSGKASITGTGTFTAGSNAEFVFNNINSSLNAMGTFSLTGGSQTIKNLTLNLASTTSSDQILILGSPVTVTGTLTLTGGYLTTSSANLLTLGSAAIISGGSTSSFVNGPLSRTIATSSPVANDYPIGKGTAYRPLQLTVTQSAATSTVYTAEQFNTLPGSRTLPGSLDNVSSVRYFNITKGSGSGVTNAAIRLSYSTDDGVTDSSTLKIAKDGGAGNWIDIGGSGTANTNGTITSAINFTTFGDFVLAKNTGRVLTLQALIEGFFDGSSMISDSVTVELHEAVSPYSLVESQKGVLNTAGTGIVTFRTALNSTSYYIAIKHRNAVETWSAAGNVFSASVLNYDFTTSADKAYGSNLTPKGSKWCIYSGDVNHDGIVDSGDLGIVDNDNANYASGYTDTDVNGDGIVDSGDLGMVDNNNALYAGSIIPTGVQAGKIVKQPLKLDIKN